MIADFVITTKWQNSFGQKFGQVAVGFSSCVGVSWNSGYLIPCLIETENIEARL